MASGRVNTVVAVESAGFARSWWQDHREHHVALSSRGFAICLDGRQMVVCL